MNNSPMRVANGRVAARCHHQSLRELDYCVVDLETTGGSPAGARITEIGAVRLTSLRETARFSTLVNPGCPVPKNVQELTGIDDGLLLGAPAIETALPRFVGFAADRILVAHSAPFDLRFLNYERHRQTGELFRQPWIDTLALARALLGRRVERHDLATLSRWASTSVRPGHRALADARATGELLVKLLAEAERQGVRSLADLADLLGPPQRRYAPRSALAEHLPGRRGVYMLRDRRGRALYVAGAANLRREVRRLFLHDGTKDVALARAVRDTAHITYEAHGSRFGTLMRAVELARRAGLPEEPFRGGSPYYLVPTAVGRDAPLAVRDAAAADGDSRFGPLYGERRLRHAGRCLRLLYPTDGEQCVADAVAALTALLAGERDARADFAVRLQRAQLDGRIDPTSASGHKMTAALDGVLAELDAVRRLRDDRLLLVEQGIQPAAADAFLIVDGTLIRRVALTANTWRRHTQETLTYLQHLSASGPPANGLRPPRGLIERRLAERVAHPAVISLPPGRSADETFAAVEAAVHSVTDPGGSDARRLTG